MDEKLFDSLLHELTAISQMFHSYEQLCQNLSFKIQPKKIREICHKGAIQCRTIRQAILETYKKDPSSPPTKS